MPFVTPADPVSGASAPASWGDAVRDDLIFFENVPACLAYQGVAQSVGSGSVATLLYDAERFDTDAMHSTSVSTNRLTFTTAGIYLVGINSIWQSDTDYLRVAVGIRNSGGTVLAQHDGYFGNTSLPPCIGTATLYKFAAGDWVDSFAFQTNTSSNANTVSASFWAKREGAG